MWSAGAGCLYQPSIHANIALWAWARVGQDCRSSSSVFIVAKNDSATTLSQHWPRRPTDRGTASRACWAPTY